MFKKSIVMPTVYRIFKAFKTSPCIWVPFHETRFWQRYFSIVTFRSSGSLSLSLSLKKSYLISSPFKRRATFGKRELWCYSSSSYKNHLKFWLQYWAVKGFEIWVCKCSLEFCRLFRIPRQLARDQKCNTERNFLYITSFWSNNPVMIWKVC